MEAAQLSALSLWIGLNILLTLLLAVNVVRNRFKAQGDSGDPVTLEKAVRAHGNNTEYVPSILIGLGLMAMSGASAQTINVLGGTLFVMRILHAYGISQRKVPNPFGLVGNMGTWLTMLCVAITLIMNGM